MRFPDAIRYVAIEGVIGAGKSTLVRILGQRLKSEVLFEEYENNPFLSGFYEDRSRYAFQTQMFFLLSRFNQIRERFHQQDLFAPLTISDYMFAKDRIFASLNLDENELALYDRLADLMERQLFQPDYVIYLQADTRVLMRRIRKRDRPYERDMDEEYIDALNRSYNQFFHHWRGSPLLIINTNHIDFVERPEDLELLLEEITKAPPGTTFLSPVSAGKR